MAFRQFPDGYRPPPRAWSTGIWVLVLSLLGNLAMPLAAQGAASWVSGHWAKEVELIPICTAQGIRIVPLSALADEPHGQTPSDTGEPRPGAGFGHCDACLGGMHSAHAAGHGAGLAGVEDWRAPQIAGVLFDLIRHPLAYRWRARGPPAFG